MTSKFDEVSLIKFLKKLHAWDKYIHNSIEFGPGPNYITRQSIIANIAPIEVAFKWAGTPEGCDYWYTLNKKYYDRPKR